MMDEGPEESEESVLLLFANTDYSRVDDLLLAVRPDVALRCVAGRRLILEDDLRQTYLIEQMETSAESQWAAGFHPTRTTDHRHPIRRAPLRGVT